jgi:hypothetical protein
MITQPERRLLFHISIRAERCSILPIWRCLLLAPDSALLHPVTNNNITTTDKYLQNIQSKG